MMALKEALDFIHRFNDTRGSEEPKLIDNARLKGDVLLVITDHTRMLPGADDKWVERRWTLFLHGRHVASGSIEDED